MQAADYPDVPDDFGHWLAGFIDGEGSFQIARIHRAGYLTYQCRFALTLRADERAILHMIHRTTGLGTIRDRPAQRGEPNWNPARTWHVTNKAGCLALVRLLERFPLRAKKARDLEIWAAAVRYWIANYRQYRHGHQQADWTPMKKFSDALIETRRYDATHEPVPSPSPLAQTAQLEGI